MEKAGIDCFMMTKKLRDKIEAKVQDGDSSGILKLIDREHETIFREIKKSQRDEVDKWRNEG
jgi:IS30 family transposase